jgi:uroporphyrinogen decarboxylase
MDFPNYRFPMGSLPTRLEDATAQIQAIRDRKEKYIVGYIGFGIFELGQSLRGMENFLIDLYSDKKMALRLIRELTNFHLSLIEEWGRLGVDAVNITDDWGGQNALMISPQLFRECFKPYYQELFTCAHRNGMQVIFHSCGAVQEIIGDLLQAGMDVLHPIQPGSNSYDDIAKAYGNDLTVKGGLDVQHTLTRGTQEEIERSLYYFVETFRKYECGVILSPTNTIVPDTPIENIEFAFRIMHKISQETRNGVVLST